MSNIFVDRTRSQAAYGLQMHKKKNFINTQESWESRANQNDNLKGYNSNVELGTSKGFAWGNDREQAVRHMSEYQNQELPYTSNAEKSHNWKQYNSYENQDHLNKTKDMLKNEINNIALRIVKARDAKQNMNYNQESQQIEGNWKVPEIEAMNRNFNESTRYYNCFPYQKKHGTRYIPPPKAEHIQQLRDEMAINETQHPNYLKNFLYNGGKNTRSMSQANRLDRFDELQQEVEDAEPVDQVMHAMQNSKYNSRGGHYNQTQPLFHKRGKSSYNIQRENTAASLNKMRDSFTNNAIQNDTESMKSAQRVLKLAHKAGAGFQFPKRERFNEQVDDEIKSQRNVAHERLNSSQSLRRKLIKNNLNTVDERSVRSGGGSQNGSKITSHSRTLSKKSITKSELSRFFKRNRNVNAPETQVAFSRVNFKNSGQSVTGSANKTVSHGYRQKFFRKLDQGNPRYNADKPESQMGLLTGQRTRPDGFAEPTRSEIDEHERKMSSTYQTEQQIDTKDTLEGRDVLVRDQTRFYKENQVNNDIEEDRLTVDILKTLDEKNVVHENPDVDQITFNDVESEEENQNQFTDTQGQKFSSTLSNGGGAHRLASWGTGYQSGMPLSYYRTPENVQSKQYSKNRILEADQQTVASTQMEMMSQVSAAPTSVISRECTKITQKLQEQLQTRLRLEKEVRELQKQAEKTKKFISMQGNDNNAQKLLVTDQRNLMYSGQNYMRHPQVEDL